MTSELGELFSAWKAHKREVKQHNKENSTKLLQQRGIPFKICNDGLHLIIETKNSITDFWPSTGKWCIKNKKRVGRGIFNLLRELDKED